MFTYIRILLVNLFKDFIYDITFNNEELNSNYLEVLKVFMNSGMNPNILDENNGLLVIEEVINHCFDMRYYDYLLGKNINLNNINKDGDTILDIFEKRCVECYHKKENKNVDFGLSNLEKYYFYREIILLLKAYDAKCSFEI